MFVRGDSKFLRRSRSSIKFFTFSVLILQSCLAMAQNKQVLPIQHWNTKNGAAVYFVQSNQLPMLDVQVAFDAGSARDGDLFGLANLTGSMLNQGADKLTADQIAQQFDNLGAQYDVTTNQDMTVVSLRTLSKPELLDSALQLFQDVITKPTFPEIAFKNEQGIALATIQAAKQDPNQVGNIEFMRLLYNHFPYAEPYFGTQSAVTKLTRENLVHFYQQYYVAKNAIIAIVGDIDRSKAELIANQITDKLTPGQQAQPLPEIKPVKSQTIHINYPSTQTTIYLGQIGVKRGDKDYFPLLVGNYTLGGDSVSRLFSVVREKYGYTYGVYSGFIPLKDAGPFYVSLQSQTKNVDPAIKLTREIVATYVANGPSPAELNAAKQNLIGSFPLRIDSNADIANYLVVIGFYHLPLTYLDDFVSNIAKVTLPQVQQALKTRINPADFITVTVGQTGAQTK